MRATGLSISYRQSIEGVIRQGIKDIIVDPAFAYRIVRISVHRDLSPWLVSGRTIIIRIVTNNAELLLGRFPPFTKYSDRGYHENYFLGLLRGWARAENVPEELEFKLVVQNSGETRGSGSVLLTSSDAIRLGVLEPGARMGKMLRRYALPYVLVSGSEVSSPSYGMIRALEDLFVDRRIRSVLDLFSGLGSLARVALELGAESVDCVESNRSVAAKALQDKTEGWRLHRADAFRFIPSDDYDLAIVDPFFEHSLQVAHRLIGRVSKCARGVVFNIGPSGRTERIARVADAACTAAPGWRLHRYSDHVVMVK